MDNRLLYLFAMARYQAERATYFSTVGNFGYSLYEADLRAQYCGDYLGYAYRIALGEYSFKLEVSNE